MKFSILVFILVLISNVLWAEPPVVIVNETDTEVTTEMRDGVLYIKIVDKQITVVKKKEFEVGESYFDGCNTHTYQGGGAWLVTCVYCPSKSISVLPLMLDPEMLQDTQPSLLLWLDPSTLKDEQYLPLGIPPQYITLENKWPELSTITFIE